MRTPEPTAPAILLTLIAGIAFAPFAAAGAGDVGRELDSVERALAAERNHEQALESAAAVLAHEIAALRLELVEAADRLQDYEERVTALETRLTELTRLEAEKSAALRRHNEVLAATLGALQRLSRQPPEALVATPAAIDDTVRTSLLLGAAVPLLDDQARSLRAELEALAALHREIATERIEFEAATADLASQRERLVSLHERKATLQHDTQDQRHQAEERVARLAAEAKSLRELLDRLAPAVAVALPLPEEKPAGPEAEPPAAAEIGPGESVAVLALSSAVGAADVVARSFSAARGSLPMPARGRLVGLFGQMTNGVKNKGINIETREDAQVVTPYDGEVVFAGPFRGYGQLLIIEHGEGYHTLLAGISRIDSVLGQWLLAGEPVGVMGRGPSGNPVLYIELRRNGVAINPLPWLTASEKKVSG